MVYYLNLRDKKEKCEDRRDKISKAMFYFTSGQSVIN